MLNLPTPARIGVIHLPPLPGSARHTLDVDEIARRAVADARTLADCGFDAAIIENFGDAPFAATTLPPASLAVMAVVADRVRREVPLRLGINALRNDARAALAIAVSCGGTFIRVNVHTGVAATDQGLIEGKAHETLALRRLLGGRVAILADVHVKHAVSLGEPDIARSARDTAYRGLADGLIVTGPATGEAAAVSDLRRVREAVPDRRLFVGSGVTAANVGELLSVADGIIVGSSIRAPASGAGDAAAALWSRPIDPQRAAALVQAATQATGR